MQCCLINNLITNDILKEISISPIKFIGGLEDLYMLTLVPRTDKNLKKLNEIRIREALLHLAKADI